MYAAFDHFLSVSTWHTGHVLDNDRFNNALAQVVQQPGFNLDEMADYFENKVGSAYPDAIQSRRDAAWAVKEYLERR